MDTVSVEAMVARNSVRRRYELDIRQHLSYVVSPLRLPLLRCQEEVGSTVDQNS